VMGLGFIAMVPFVIIAEKKRRMREVFLGAILTLSIAAFSMYWTSQSLVWFWLSLFGFFMAFNLLEATLPSLISKVCPPGGKGSAMGIYSSSQFFGAFIGRSEEHTSELQSRENLVCRLLLEKKNNNNQ